MTATTTRAAERLVGTTLGDGWKVIERLTRSLDATGGFFSVGYLVENTDGRRGFLKALDYSEAFDPTSPVPISIALQELTEAINFEKYVLARCRDRGLDRIVVSIADGTLTLGQPGVETVEYLIFELADGDSRRQMALVDRLDLAWRFKSLHDVATGLQQLHGIDIVHQDLKPSNILFFKRMSKLADFGRSACDGQHPPHEKEAFAGDYGYAPPDVLYRFSLADQKLRQLSFDAYLLGSMVVFFFTGQGATSLILKEIPHPYSDWEHYAGTVEDAKLYIRDAFGRFLLNLDNDLPAQFRRDLIQIVRELCEPDPARRGHPKERRGTPSQFSVSRYIARFDLLLKRAEVGLFPGRV